MESPKAKGTEMKKLFSGLFASLFAASSASAGDLAEPVITEVEEPAAASSSAPWVPLLLLIGVGILIASQDDNSPSQKAKSAKKSM